MSEGGPTNPGKPRRTVHVVHPKAAPSGAPRDNAEQSDLLRSILDEMRQSRAEAEASNRRLTEALRREMQWNRRLLRLLVQQQAQPLEDEIAGTFDAIQLGFAETLDVIHRERLSLARFGDGELMLMLDPDHNLQFQPNSAPLRQDLAQTLALQWAAESRVLVALPHLFRNDVHWMGVWSQIWGRFKPHLDLAGRYGNAHVSRPIFFRDQGAAGIARWRRLWEGREVLIVTGRDSRFDPVPALFDGTARIEILHTLAQDAYRYRDAILKQVLARARPDTLVLLSLGPAATVLVPAIAAQGLQALDVGHISASYLNVYSGGAAPESLPASRTPGA